MKITYLGHSALLFEGRWTILVDPFISGNPWVQGKDIDVKPDYILVSHAHGDHLGDAVEIAAGSGSVIIATYELATWCGRQGVKTHPMHIGGRYPFEFGWLKMTSALHGSGMISEDGIEYMGSPCGFLWESEGKRFYFAGDTALTYDMRLLEEYHVDYAFLPIGGNFTMDGEDALKAAGFISARHVIPIHYNTFDLIKASPDDFIEKAGKMGIDGISLKPGMTLDI